MTRNDVVIALHCAFLLALQFMFLVAKALGIGPIAGWSWLAVFAPTWVPIAAFGALIFLVVAIVTIRTVIGFVRATPK